MGMNDTPSADRVHIGFFGKRNAGKSSVLNAVTGQDLAVVSDVRGTTTDPVSKAMELLPLGPVVMIDTPGIDDEGELGALRVKKSYQTLNKTDVAVLVVDAAAGPGPEDLELFGRICQKQIPVVVAYNKADTLESAENQPGGSGGDSAEKQPVGSVPEPTAEPAEQKAPVPGLSAPQPWGGSQPWDATQPLYISARTGQGIAELKERLAQLGKPQENSRRIVADLLEPMDLAVLVVPIDSAAPKGRLILPQQQTIRDVLEASAVAVVVKDTELKETLSGLGKKPKLVITDSQAFARVSRETPEDVLLTSFSILFARYKGNLAAAAAGARAVEQVGDGDPVLICEGCTHHRQCEDIGTVKLPRWIREYTGAEPEFVFTSGTAFPDDLSPYRLVVHCGACMLNEREMKYRLKCAQDQGVPMTNYGILIAYMQGILQRSVQAFPDIAALVGPDARRG
ncbi:[FeFe] hydrogenase H-cluster maturation GTPase HydF [Enterocloster lavalensis]|uniref:[FeFe] hydrogenase H-cluster maturation GTPase HydF n=1 Tax=Enterocloster lavalensis TaxID=460384 RepID=A0A1I0J1T1_9FIRM|nr:[FeFe] hydrogenase H-cluster maturation GTPase HydF [Enterocloster lavalensis]PST33932.1 [FeFe] hydrogenase H-cluster maturation GTPase HydF [Enterocloster lavalensis]SEU03711.1 [FeFe] hydrogenase H-cluster maturation GTPase HydF [Enterocloster lavalensis]